MSHTYEECARRVLEIMSEANVQMGKNISRNSFVLPYSKSPWGPSEFGMGEREAEARGWITIENNVLTLTEAGAYELS